MLALKKKSILKNYKKNIDKYVQKERVQNTKPIKNILLIVKESVKDAVLNDINKNSTLGKINIQTLVSCTYDKKRTYTENEITIKDISIAAKIKKEEVISIGEKPYDLVINYDVTNDVVLNYLASKVNAMFFIGFAKQENELNDLVIKADKEDYQSFHNEIVKYLKILKKL